MTRLPPEPNEEWQHFKGKKYRILGISSYRSKLPSFPPSYCAQHTESLISLNVYVFDGRGMFLCEFEDGRVQAIQSYLSLTLEDGMTAIGTPHVVYRGAEQLDISVCPIIWARPLPMFMSEIDGHYRFEKSK